MQKQFTQFAENIRLTANQEADAKTKYEGVCKKLHSSYYSSEYDGSTKLLIGSYKTKTNVRPLTEKQDVDVLFKIPKATYDQFKSYTSNGPAALLQEIKNCLKEKYTTTEEIKAWSKVVLLKFADNTHNIEVLPAYEEEDGTFIMPNSENGGSWEVINPREQLSIFQNSNTSTNGLTAELTRMLKTWVNYNVTCDYKSYKLLSDVMTFLDVEFKKGADYSEYSQVIKRFFEYLNNNCEDHIASFVKGAVDTSTKACNYENEGKPKEASEEWRKIFGAEYPLVSTNPVKENSSRVFTNPSSPYGHCNIIQ